jgi:hypothetical protein
VFTFQEKFTIVFILPAELVPIKRDVDFVSQKTIRANGERIKGTEYPGMIMETRLQPGNMPCSKWPVILLNGCC